MNNIKELKDEELGKVSGGISDVDISELISGLQQIKSIISNSQLNWTQKNNINAYADDAIMYINERDFQSAKQSFNTLLEYANQYAAQSPELFSNGFTDVMSYVGLLMQNC